jgi:hypothetical protein
VTRLTVRNLESLAIVDKIGGWIEVLMKIFIKTSDICQESNLTKGLTNYILLVRNDRLDSSCINLLSERLPLVYRNSSIERHGLGKGCAALYGRQP